ncbi:S1C family serine protease [Amphibacillus cookii]|uniref:S1C family serine protease n=1 Tax=Amphibacillus cookii TaxID=767787 RepID=UPI00195C24A2|nr:trypsin-like peptidase domain-containing protein [Amphibacillus cookii]MBM7542928.1 serine protease Do [Amphibacillus cookii]
MSEFHDQHQLNDEKQSISNDQPSQVIDNQIHSNTEVNQEDKKTKPNAWMIWLSGITGGLTVAIIGFLLLFTGLIPLNITEQSEDLVSQEATSQNVIQTSTGDDGVSSEVLSNVAGAVVGIANVQSLDLWSDNAESGSGSGVVYKIEDDRAYIVTNHHVIDGANEIEVILSDDERVPAELHGSDELTDLAVLSIDAEHVDTVATFGTSSDLVVGETAIAIGNPLGTDFAGTVTKGIISGLDRSLDVDLNNDGTADWTVDVIQTDAAINPGNSGGALVNGAGEVIGINSMKIALSTVEGIGFAIPIDEAQPVIEQLETNGSITRPFMGISAIDFSSVPQQHIQQTLNLDPSEIESGIVIAEVHPGSAADQAGLDVYDVVTAIDGEAIDDMMDLRQYLYSETEVGDTITITYYRNGVAEETTVTLQGE